MKLGEALTVRADAARRVEQLQARIVASARFQEGEKPAEDAAAGKNRPGIAAQHLAPVTGNSARCITTCRSAAMRVGSGHSTSQVRLVELTSIGEFDGVARGRWAGRPAMLGGRAAWASMRAGPREYLRL